jgi:hypothetical protein
MMYTSPQATVALLARGMRIGIASHGHKAITRLLQEMAKVASMACDIANVAVGTLPQAYGSCSAASNGGKHV